MPDKFIKFYIFSVYGDALPIAYHLKAEGMDVTMAMVDDYKSVGMKTEEPEYHKSRWSQYEGMLDVITCEQALKRMAHERNKDEVCILFDLNILWPFANQARVLGFKYGIFPSKLHRRLEDDREFAKKFVLENYPGLKCAECQDFKNVDEAIEFVNGSDEFWALKGNDPDCSTVVPRQKNIEHVKAEIIEALQSGRADYEKKGFILERQIRDGLEMCPSMIWSGGKRVASLVNLEDKAYSATDSSKMYGCSINMIVATPLDCELNQIAFPPAADKLAKLEKGLFYLDANIIQKDGDFYFLEFCPQRMGFDQVYAEMEMAGTVSDYFNKLLHGENPYNAKYGAGVHAFSTEKDDGGRVKDEIPLRLDEEERHVWYMGVKKKGENIVNTKGSFGEPIVGIDLVAFTEDSDDPEYALIKMRDVVKNFSFAGLYLRDDWDKIMDRVEKIEKWISCDDDS